MERVGTKGWLILGAAVALWGCAADPSVGSSTDNMEERVTVDTRWQLTVVDASFDDTYLGAPWDTDGSGADPVVDISAGYEPYARLGGTSVQFDTASPAWEESTATFESLALDRDGFGLSLLDFDESVEQNVRDDIKDNNYPGDDYIASVGTLMLAEMYEAPQYTFDLDYGGVAASVTVRFMPVSPGCGDVPAEGICEGNLVRVCVADKGGVYELDCAARGGVCSDGFCRYDAGE